MLVGFANAHSIDATDVSQKPLKKEEGRGAHPVVSNMLHFIVKDADIYKNNNTIMFLYTHS